MKKPHKKRINNNSNIKNTESITLTEIENSPNKAKILRELSPKQKESINKKAIDYINNKKEKDLNKKERDKEILKSINKSKEQIRSLSPQDKKYDTKKVKSIEKSTSRPTSNTRSIENCISENRNKSNNKENRESLLTFGNRTDRSKLLINKDSIISNSDSGINLNIVKKLLKQAFVNSKTDRQYEEFLNSIFSDNLKIDRKSHHSEFSHQTELQDNIYDSASSLANSMNHLDNIKSSLDVVDTNRLIVENNNRLIDEK